MQKKRWSSDWNEWNSVTMNGWLDVARISCTKGPKRAGQHSHDCCHPFLFNQTDLLRQRALDLVPLDHLLLRQHCHGATIQDDQLRLPLCERGL